MSGFFAALLDPAFPFIRNALLAGLLSSLLFGVLGAVVTVRRIASLAGAISHAALGGIGMALYVTSAGILSMRPVTGALIFALLSALLIGVVSIRARRRVDTLINAIWAVGMSAGVLFMAKTKGYVDPSSYLFGNILLIAEGDLVPLGALGVAAVLLACLFYPQIQAASFDEEYARVRAVPANLVFFVILLLSAAAIVLLQTFVGIVMVIAMLCLPAGTAACFVKSLSGMMAASCILSALFSVAGLISGWTFDLPVGAMTVIISGAVFLLATALRALTARLGGR